MLYEPEAIGVIGAYSPTRRARVYEPEAAPEGFRIGGIATLYQFNGPFDTKAHDRPFDKKAHDRQNSLNPKSKIQNCTQCLFNIIIFID
jgi:hypothetical protein